MTYIETLLRELLRFLNVVIAPIVSVKQIFLKNKRTLKYLTNPIMKMATTLNIHTLF